MLVTNSILIADFIKGIYWPLAILGVLDALALLFSTITWADSDELKEHRWYTLGMFLFLVFCAWFFFTFSLAAGA